MHNPPHPGAVVKHDLIEGTGFSVTRAAEILGVQRVTLSKLINQRTGISAEMAVRLSLALGTSSQLWINLQAMYDLCQAEKKRKNLKVLSVNKLLHAHAA